MTNEEFLALINAYVKQMQMPAAMSRLSQISMQSKDAAANHIAQQAISVATAVQEDNGRLVKCLIGAADYFNTVGDSIHAGMTTHSFAGSIAYETDTQTVTGQTWVVDAATTPVFAFTNAEESTSDVIGNGFRMQVNNYVAGVGFDVIMKSLLAAGLPGAASWDAWWFGFPS